MPIVAISTDFANGSAEFDDAKKLYDIQIAGENSAWRIHEDGPGAKIVRRRLALAFPETNRQGFGFHWKDFGFPSLRRDAITSIGSAAGISQAMSAAGHSHADTSLLYTLRNLAEQGR